MSDMSDLSADVLAAGQAPPLAPPPTGYPQGPARQGVVTPLPPGTLPPLRPTVSLVDYEDTLAQAIGRWTKDFRLKTKQLDPLGQPVLRAPQIFTGDLPLQEAGQALGDDLPLCPYVVVSLHEGTDHFQHSAVITEIEIGVWDNAVDRQGHRDLVALATEIRLRLWQDARPLHRSMALTEPLHWAIRRPTREEGKVSYWPYFFGTLQATWLTPTPTARRGPQMF